MTGSYISLGLDFKSKPLVSTDRAKVSDIEIVLTRKGTIIFLKKAKGTWGFPPITLYDLIILLI